MKNIFLTLFLVLTTFLSGIGMVLLSLQLSKTNHPSPLFAQPESTIQTLPPNSSVNPVVYGYLPYWNRDKAQFPSSLTHVSYFSLPIQKDGSLLSVVPEKQDPGYRLFNQGYLHDLKQDLLPHQKLELTLSMMDQDEIPVFIHNKEAHNRLISEIVTILDQYPISGINIDIEYNGSVTPTLQEDFSSLLALIRKHVKQKDSTFLLSMAVYGDSGQSNRLTELQSAHPYLDYIVVMAYDYHRRSSPRSGPISPLYGKLDGKWEGDIMEDLQSIRQKVPAEKILLGIPFYGYEWSVEDPSNPQSFTLPRSGATASYQRIQELLKNPDTQVFWDSWALSPYLQYTKNGNYQRIYYDNPLSLSYKLDLVQKAGFGGIAIWALGYEGSHTDLWNTIDLVL